MLHTAIRAVTLSRPRGSDFLHVTTTTWVSFMKSLRRLGYYIILLNFRGWVLYVGLNAVEDMLVRPVDTSTCWYHDWLRSDQPQCFGRVFDFSDHIVLYYAQILPVALFEFLHSMEYPYWKQSSPVASQLDNRWSTISIITVQHLFPLCLYSCMCYLYFITCLGVYKTALYFHTGPEVAVGFLVAQVVHFPLCVLQCSDQLEPMREFLFVASSGITKYKSLS